MKHFILTRFNLKNSAWGNNDHGIPKALSEEWLNNRIELFKNYCLPSIENQTSKNFIWFLILDIDTPEFFKQTIEKLTKVDINVRIIFSDGFKYLIPTLLTEINNCIDKSDNYIITTRLDNDDIVHKDFIKTIQELYKPKSKMIIDLKAGYQLILEKPFEIRSMKYNFNPFISLVESTTDFKTVLNKEHLLWKDDTSEHIKYSKKGLWIQLIHDQNQLNQKISYLKRVKTIKASSFGLSINIKSYSYIENLFFNFRLIPQAILNKFKTTIKNLLIKN